MKILSIIKGFVTNSSSANYWLDNSTSTDQNVIKELANNKSEQLSLNAIQSQNTKTLPSIKLTNIIIFPIFIILVLIIIVWRKIIKL